MRASGQDLRSQHYLSVEAGGRGQDCLDDLLLRLVSVFMELVGKVEESFPLLDVE